MKPDRKLLFGIYETEDGAIELFINVTPEQMPLLYILMDSEKAKMLLEVEKDMIISKEVEE